MHVCNVGKLQFSLCETKILGCIAESKIISSYAVSRVIVLGKPPTGLSFIQYKDMKQTVLIPWLWMLLIRVIKSTTSKLFAVG